MSYNIEDINAEMCVVGTLLVNNDFLLKSDILLPKHFYYKELATLYYAMRKLVDHKVLTFDALSIANVIEQSKSMKKHIENAGIKDLFEYIEDLKMLSRNDYNEYNTLVKRIMTLSFKRKTKDTLQALINECNSDKEEDLNEFNYRLQNEVSNIPTEYMFDDDTPLLADVVDDIWEKIKSRRTADGIIGIPSAYESINKYFTYRQGELVIIAARAKVGKSQFVMNEVYHKLKNGVKCAIFDTELSDEIWLPRFLSLVTGLTVRQVETGRYDDEGERKINEVIEWIKKGTLTHIYDPEWNTSKIYTRAKTIKLKHGLDFLVYDYIKSTGSIEEKNMQEHQYLGFLTNFLKNNVAGDLDVAVLSSAQMSDSSMRISDSAKIQRYASTIAYWFKKDTDKLLEDGADEGTHGLHIAYNRNGGCHSKDSKGEPVDYLNFVMDGDRCKITMSAIHEHDPENTMPY